MKNNNTRVIIAVLVLLLVAAGAYFALRDRGAELSGGQPTAPAPQTAAPQNEPSGPDMEEEGSASQDETRNGTATAESESEVTEDADGGSVEQQQAMLRIPTFDLLRVEPDGTAVIAGGAEPLGLLDVKEEESVLASSDVTESGDFVAIVETPLSPGDHLIYLSVTMPDGRTVRSEQTATVSIPDGNNGELLALITEPGKASEIISAPELQTTTAPETTVVATRETDGNEQTADAPDSGQDRDVLSGETSGDGDRETNLPAVNVETRGGDSEAAEAVTAAQEPVSDQKPVAVTVSIKAVEIEGDTLFVAGGKSRFLRSSHLPAIQEHFSRFSLSTIRSADHWIHADEPEALLLKGHMVLDRRHPGCEQALQHVEVDPRGQREVLGIVGQARVLLVQ